jgi:hypothetical protein
MFNSSLQQQPDYPAALASLQHMDIDSLKVIPNPSKQFYAACVKTWANFAVQLKFYLRYFSVNGK